MSPTQSNPDRQETKRKLNCTNEQGSEQPCKGWREIPSLPPKQLLSVGSVVVLFQRKHFRTIYQGCWGSNMEKLDIKEKIHCRQEGKQRRGNVRSHGVAVVTISMYLLHFLQSRREKVQNGGRTGRTPATLFSGSDLDPQTLIIHSVFPGPTSASPGSLLELLGRCSIKHILISYSTVVLNLCSS